MSTEINYVKVLDHTDLVRDKATKAVLNRDLSSLDKYKKEREDKLKMTEFIEEFPQLKDDVNEIKTLLKQLIGKNNCQ